MASPMTPGAPGPVAGSTLGDGADLRVMVTPRGSGLLLAELHPTSGFFTRSLDKASDCQLEGVVATRSAVSAWGNLHVWSTELLIRRDDRDAWVGPVVDVGFAPGGVKASAADLAAWYDRETTGTMNLLQVDASDIFKALHERITDQRPDLRFGLQATPSGTLADAVYDVDDDKYVTDALGDLSKTALDWTVYGRTALVRSQEIEAAPYATLLDEHWDTPPTVQERGTGQATVVVVHGAEGLRGVAHATDDVKAYYGRLLRVFDDSTLTTQAAVDAAAKSRLAVLQDPTFIVTPTGAGLRSTAPVTVAGLVPGRRIRVSTSASARTLTADFRLTGMKCTFDGTVSIDLEPLGAFAEN